MCHFVLCDSSLTIKLRPQWENLECTAKHQLMQWIWHTFIAGLAVCLGTVILLICAFIQYKAKNNKALKKSTAGRGGHRSSVQTGKHVLAQASGATTLTEQKVDEDEEDEGEEEKKDAL